MTVSQELVDTPASPAGTVRDRAAPGGGVSARARARPAPGGGGSTVAIAGTLERRDLPTLLDMFATEGMSGRLTVAGAASFPPAEILYHQGRVLEASFGDARGPGAVAALRATPQTHPHEEFAIAIRHERRLGEGPLARRTTPGAGKRAQVMVGAAQVPPRFGATRLVAIAPPQRTPSQPGLLTSDWGGWLKPAGEARRGG
jgi:hypothetical protein